MKGFLALLGVACIVGCAPAAPKTPPLATYDDARPIVARRCLGCHSGNGVAAADADLSTLPAIRSHAAAIDAKVRAGSMPPRGAPIDDDERALLLRFVEGELSR